MKVRNVALGVALLAMGSMAQAAPDAAKVQDILSKNACLACHAAKHKDDANAAQLLAKHIKEGSSGVWGPIPMPPNPNISDADIKLVVEWILAGAPQ